MERREPFISRVRLKNYKSIAECDVRLGPLTVLVGPNGSGKSNFLDALAFLARALATTPYEAIDERGGLGAILCRVPEAADSFSIEVEVTAPVDLIGAKWASVSYGVEIGQPQRRGLRPFEVIWETCVLGPEGRDGGFRSERGVVRALGAPNVRPGSIEPDRLYLPIASAQLPVASLPGGYPTASIPTPFTELFKGLSGMRFYSFALDVLRQPSRPLEGAILDRRGEHLGNVLGALEEDRPAYKERLDAYLRAVVPDAVGIDRWFDTSFVTVKLRFMTGAGGRDIAFGPHAMSDGTIRAAAVLAALFQSAVLDGRIPLVGIEEPEIALHPAAAGVLFDAKRYDAALQLLDDRINEYPDDARLYELEAKAYAALDKPQAEHHSLAYAYISRGNLMGAIDQLNLAKQSGNDYYQLSVIDGELKRFRAIAAAQAGAKGK